MPSLAALEHEPGAGSAYRYECGCRCDECREANRVKGRRNKDRARAENRSSYQRDLAASRARKESYRGTCERCGGETRYSGKGRQASRTCASCSRLLHAERQRAKRGTGPVQQRLRALLVERGEMGYTEIVRELGVSPAHARVQLNRMVGYGLVERVRRGRYRWAA